MRQATSSRSSGSRVQRRIEVAVLARLGTQDAPDLRRAIHAVAHGVVLVGAELRHVGRSAKQQLAVASAAWLRSSSCDASRNARLTALTSTMCVSLTSTGSPCPSRPRRAPPGERTREGHAEEIGGDRGQQGHQRRRRAPHPQELAGLGVDQLGGKRDPRGPAGQRHPAVTASTCSPPGSCPRSSRPIGWLRESSGTSCRAIARGRANAP